MGARSAISLLPPGARERVEAELVRRGFANYEETAQALTDILASEFGLEVKISKSALHRFGQVVEERIETLRRTTEIAKTLSKEVGDDEGAMNDALMRLLQDKLFRVAVDLEVDPGDVDVYKLGRLIAELGRASVQQKKWQREIRAAVTAAAKNAEDVARKGGLSEESVQAITREILGIPDGS